MKCLRRLGFQWAALILVLAMPLLAVIGVLLDSLAEDSQNAAFTLVLTIARDIGDGIHLDLQRKEQLAAYLAARPAIRASDPKHCDPQIVEVLRMNPTILNVILVDMQGKLVCSGLGDRAGSISYSDRDWFRDGVNGKFGWRKPVLGRATHQWISVLTHDVRDNKDELTGIMTLAIGLAESSRKIEDINLPDGSVATLVDPDGVILARTIDPQKWIGRDGRDIEFVDRALTKHDGTGILKGADGISRVYGFARIPGTALHVTVGIPVDTVMAGYRKRLESSAFWIVLAVLCAIAGAGIATKEILVPIRSVVNAAKAASSGDLAARAIKAGPVEIAELAEQFNRMQIARTAAESALRKRSGQLEAANKELEAFSYSVSHDLRTPLRAIDGFGQRLLDASRGKLDPAATHYLNRIRAGSQVMAQLIDDLLDLSRVSLTSLRIQRVDLSDIVRRVADDLRQINPERNVELSIAEGVRVDGDARLLEITMQNLLGNAWKFSANRADARIEFGQTQQGGETVCFVRDNGAGFDMAYADKLFAPFQRLHNAAEFPGTGIGLVTVQRIIRRHGGRVWIEAAVDQGTTVFFTLGNGDDDARETDTAGGRQS